MRRPPTAASSSTRAAASSSTSPSSSTAATNCNKRTKRTKKRSTTLTLQPKQARRKNGVVSREGAMILGVISLTFLMVSLAWTVSSLLGMLGSFWWLGLDVSFQDGQKKHSQRRRRHPPNKVSILDMDRRRRHEHQLQSSGTVISLERELSNISNDTTTSFCALWSVNVDAWWTHQPTWELTQQNTTHQCFRRIQNKQQHQLYKRLYGIQFPSSSCPHTSSTTNILTKHCTGSGWGVDVSHMVDGLQMALSQSVLVRILTPLPWQYAGGCPRADASCYFLPFSICDAEPREALPPGQRSPPIRYQQPWRGFAPRKVVMPNQQLDNDDDDDDDDDIFDSSEMDWTVPWLLQYATRAQTWLRHRVVQATVEHLVGPSPPSFHGQQQQPQLLSSPCIVMHVRRADVVLHGKFSRRYHAIREYVHALEQHYYDWWNISTHHTILLLTDDANAIQEAWTEYPPNQPQSNNNNIQWFYLDRPRHQADEGGWENQIPSGDAVTDVVMLLAGVELAAQHCHTLVHSKSNLADYLYASMLLAAAAAAAREPPQRDASEDEGPHISVERIDLDKDKPHQAIHQAANAESVHISTAFG